MASTLISVQHSSPLDLGATSAMDGSVLGGALAQLLKSPGEKGVSAIVALNGSRNGQTAAGTLTFASTSGTIGGTINGVAVTFASTGVDADDATAMVAAVVASSDALVSGIVRASSVSGTLACASVVAGNSFSIGGYKFVMVANGQTNLKPGDIALGTTNATTATAIAAAINALPKLNQVVWAIAETATVRIFAVNPSATLAITRMASTFTVAAMASRAVAMIRAYVPGSLGNCITLAASGTGVTASGARLAGGSVFSTIQSTTF